MSRSAKGAAGSTTPACGTFRCRSSNLDEQWSFIGCKAKRANEGDKKAGTRGDNYTFVALDATSKAVLSYVNGKRDGLNTVALATDLRARIVNRPQITADGWAPYPGAIEEAFGDDVDFATLTKEYVTTPGNEAAVRYSPGQLRGITKTIVSGDPDKSAISTSYIARFNLTTRMHVRRFTRLTNGFSKKLDNHRENRAAIRVLQPVPLARGDPLHTRDGAWRRGSHLDGGRAGRRGVIGDGAGAAPDADAAEGYERQRGKGRADRRATEKTLRHQRGPPLSGVPRDRIRVAMRRFDCPRRAQALSGSLLR